MVGTVMEALRHRQSRVGYAARRSRDSHPVPREGRPMARTLARSGHDGPSLAPANPPWQHGVSSPTPPGRPARYGLSVVSRPNPLATRSSGRSGGGGRPWAASRPPTPRGGGEATGPFLVDGSSVADARDARTARVLWPTAGAAPGVWLPCGTPARPVSCRHRLPARGPAQPPGTPTLAQAATLHGVAPGTVRVGDRAFCAAVPLARRASRDTMPSCASSSSRWWISPLPPPHHPQGLRRAPTGRPAPAAPPAGSHSPAGRGVERVRLPGHPPAG